MAKYKTFPLSLPGGRVVYVLNKHWANSQAQMARDTGLTRAAICNVVNGHRVPGREMLSRICKYSRVNADWLLFGKGEPVSEGDADYGDDRLLPVASRLAPGPIGEHGDCLTDALMPVLRRDYRQTRYWYTATASDHAAADVVGNDALLIESDGSWKKRPRLLEHHLCVIRPVTEAEPRLCKVADYMPKHGIRIPVSAVVASSLPQPAVHHVSSGGRRRLLLLKRKTAADSVGATQGAASSPESTEFETGTQTKWSKAEDTAGDCLPLDVVVGVVVLQQRRWPWG